jgi:hypothetical protein
MGRQVRDAKLETRTARERLRPHKHPYWTVNIPNEIALGYRKRKASLPGKWLVRRYGGANGTGGGKYVISTLALADDHGEANGDTILSYAEAQAVAQEKVVPSSPITVREAITGYLAYVRSRGRPTKDTEQRANSLILPVLGDKRVEELTSEELRTCIADYAERPALIRPKANGKRKERAPLAGDREAIRRRQSSASRLLTILKAALNLAFNEGSVHSNLAWKRVKPYHGVDVARVRYLSVRRLNGSSTRATLNSGRWCAALSKRVRGMVS